MSTPRIVLLGLALAAAPRLWSETDPTAARAARSELRALEGVLARAADAVARPSGFAFSHGCRGYRVPGVGVVFVLPPRTLRGGNLRVWQLSPRRGRRAPRPTEQDQEMRLIQLQAEALQEEAARAQLEVERAMEEVEQEIERRQAAPVGISEELPEPPQPKAPPTHPPWAYWFDLETPEDEGPDAAEVLSRMRTALADALAKYGASVRSLTREETLAAAVDFEPGSPLSRGATRTLVVSVRKRDLEEHAAGKLEAAGLRARIEASEY